MPSRILDDLRRRRSIALAELAVLDELGRAIGRSEAPESHVHQVRPHGRAHASRVGAFILYVAAVAVEIDVRKDPKAGRPEDAFMGISKSEDDDCLGMFGTYKRMASQTKAL